MTLIFAALKIRIRKPVTYSKMIFLKKHSSIMKIRILLVLLFSSIIFHAQQTVGLFLNTPESYNGYTMFAPLKNTTSYLIDNCGEKVHSWDSSYIPAASAYILEDGTLLRTGYVGNTIFVAGGNGGIIEMIDWDGNVIWDYTLSSTTELLHHDLEYLPNGNILAIVWDLKTQEETSQAGRTDASDSIWSEKIIEIQPNLSTGESTIVWEWKVWDHLVQDVDANLDNYGTIASSPELININFHGGDPKTDWLHINGIDYNEDLDQIVLSIHTFSEIWIIDHATSTAEAASHSGGNQNKGGDLLYRWGNPQAYNQGSSVDQQLFKQHNPNWIDNSFLDEGMIMVFNNQAGGQGISSTVNTINTPVSVSGSYTYTGGAFEPTNFHWTYEAATPTDFYAGFISGARRLPNDNTLICQGPVGKFFEVDYNGNIVWEYVNPVNDVGPVTQEDLPGQNSVFRATRYASDFSGFTGKDLTPQGYIETGSTFECDLYLGIDEELVETEISIFPNPVNDKLNIHSENQIDSILIYNSIGEVIARSYPNSNDAILDLSNFVNGIYFSQIKTKNEKRYFKKIVIAH